MASEVNERLCDAARAGDVAKIERSIAAGADPNALVGGSTPLHWAASLGHVAAIAALLAAGARVDGASSGGWTPLMCAAANDSTAAVDALLAAGADVHLANQDGDTALHWASMNGHVDAARVLLEAGARTDVRNKHGKRPIGMVCCRLACSLDRTHGSRAQLPRRRAQVWGCDEAIKAALRALLASAEPWSRRRPVALACYGVDWEW
jgi:ankyrin repeat protein